MLNTSKYLHSNIEGVTHQAKLPQAYKAWHKDGITIIDYGCAPGLSGNYAPCGLAPWRYAVPFIHSKGGDARVSIAPGDVGLYR